MATPEHNVFYLRLIGPDERLEEPEEIQEEDSLLTRGMFDLDEASRMFKDENALWTLRSELGQRLVLLQIRASKIKPERRDGLWGLAFSDSTKIKSPDGIQTGQDYLQEEIDDRLSPKGKSPRLIVLKREMYTEFGINLQTSKQSSGGFSGR